MKHVKPQVERESRRPRNYSPEYEKSFNAVLPIYIHSKYSLANAVIQACNPDPEGKRGVHAYVLCEYVADVESAFEDACEDNLHLMNGLLSIVNEGLEVAEGPEDQDQIDTDTDTEVPPISKSLRQEVIFKVGRLFQIRGLKPEHYFRHKKGRIHREGKQ